MDVLLGGSASSVLQKLPASTPARGFSGSAGDGLFTTSHLHGGAGLGHASYPLHMPLELALCALLFGPS